MFLSIILCESTVLQVWDYKHICSLASGRQDCPCAGRLHRYVAALFSSRSGRLLVVWVITALTARPICDAMFLLSAIYPVCSTTNGLVFGINVHKCAYSVNLFEILLKVSDLFLSFGEVIPPCCTLPCPLDAMPAFVTFASPLQVRTLCLHVLISNFSMFFHPRPL